LRTIHQALAMLNRHGDRSYYRRVLSNAELDALTLAELQDLIRSLPTYAQRWAYAGPRSAAEAAAAVAHAWPLPAELREPPPFEPLWVRDPGRNEIYLFDQEMAQALIRLDFGGVPYDRRLATAIQLFNEYFYGGMSGIVFQELREARALAYSTWAYFFEAARTEDRNMASGYISTQADKTGEAVAAFVGLFDQMPVTPARFASAREALLGRWRSERLGFRRVLEAVRSWELQGLAADPRAETYRQLQEASIADLLAFYRDHVQGKAKLISIVGDRRRLDLDALRQHGEVIEVRLEDIFAF